MAKRFLFVILIAILILFPPVTALAQTYSFGVPAETVNVYLNEDGTQTIDYVFTFSNSANASPIDYVDVGVPNSNYDLSSVTADVNGSPVYDITESPYVDPGVAIGLGNYAIMPGDSGNVHVNIGMVEKVLRQDSSDSNYASAVFSPTWFDSSFVQGATNLTVIFHMPPGVLPEEPRWHESPSGWESTPVTGFDNQGRITYSWNNLYASASEQYKFGASFPKTYVPESAVSSPGFFESLGITEDDAIGYCFCCFFGLVIIGIPILIYISNRQRKMKYLPPKISIEGHGIKRGLTAIESAILLEEPLDKVLTMILFSVIKKSAAKVTTRDPLQLEAIDPQPEGLHDYEKDFISAFTIATPEKRKKELQDLSINLIKSVSSKMKGFSRKETIAYYKEIVKRAWAQVESADTPEVKSQKYDEVMEWTMLDRDYDRRTQDVFRTGPVFIPTWWGHYDPTYTRPAVSLPSPGMPSTGNISMPHLPGSDFAASIVNGVQNVSSKVIGNVSDFTGKVTNKTNPVPVSTSSGRSSGHRGGGGGCACACACAGCACACAGGGR